MLRITALLFHGSYSLAAKKQPYASARADAALSLLTCFYLFVSFDLLLVADKVLSRFALPGQGILLLLLLLVVVGSLVGEVRYFKRHYLATQLEQYEHEIGMRRLAYALGKMLVLALVMAFPFSGIL
jgi:hypothetical protein